MTAFPKNSRVLFIGDSITAACNYTARIVEFYKNNLPELSVHFRNVGVSGAWAETVQLIFDEKIAPYKPTHAAIMLGVNDSHRWLLDRPDSPERARELDDAFAVYADKMERILDRLSDIGCEVTLCTPVPYAEFFKTTEKPLPGGYALILRYAEHVRKVAKARGLSLCDYHARFAELSPIEPLYNPDHVHPSDLGHYRMTQCFLASQGLDAGEYRPIEEILSDKSLAAWNDLTYRLGHVAAAQWMIVKHYDAPLDEQLDIARDYVDNKRYQTPYFEMIANRFLELRPRQAELYLEADRMMSELYK